MIDPVAGPFLFDTSADSYLGKRARQEEREWLNRYLALFPARVSVLTVVERIRGYAVLLERLELPHRVRIEAARHEYRQGLESGVTQVLPLTTPAALLGAELLAVCPSPASPRRQSHRLVESRQGRVARWRFDILIAATALAADLPLVHNNPEDFEAMRAVIERFPERFPGAGPLNLISVRRLTE